MQTAYDVIIPDYSEYSAPQSRMLGLHSMYSGMRKRLNQTVFPGKFCLFLFQNMVNKTHNYRAKCNLGKVKLETMLASGFPLLLGVAR